MASLVFYTASSVHTLLGLFIVASAFFGSKTPLTLQSVLLAGSSLTLGAALCGAATLEGRARGKFARSVCAGYLTLFVGGVWCLEYSHNDYGVLLYSLLGCSAGLFAGMFLIGWTKDVKTSQSRL